MPIGAHAGELILPWTLALARGLKIGALASLVAPYPSLSEVTKSAAGSFFTQRLFEEGIFATPAIFPAVRYGEAIVRTSFMATHTDSDLDRVLEIFEKLARELGTFDDPAYVNPTRRKNVFDFRLPDAGGEEDVRAGGGEASRNGSGIRPSVSR